jgi:hypothetical protein
MQIQWRRAKVLEMSSGYSEKEIAERLYGHLIEKVIAGDSTNEKYEGLVSGS